MNPNFVVLYVKDPAASAAFYSRLFGNQPVEASPNFVMFGLQAGMMLGLWMREEVAPAVHSEPGASELAISVENRGQVDSMLGEWRAAGAVIAMEPKTLDFGYGFVARDPDGHLVRVFVPTAAPEGAGG